MPQSLMKVNVHMVFSTKNRACFLDKTIRSDVHSYLGGILRNTGCLPIQVGGVEDHVHLLFVLTRTLAVAKLVENLKRGSTTWLQEKARRYEQFHWQHGYGAFSVNESDVPRVKAYIENQEAHHVHLSFEDELRGFLKEYNLEYDERYLWD